MAKDLVRERISDRSNNTKDLEKKGRAQSVQEIQSRSVELKLEEGMLTNRRWCKVGKELRPEITRQIIIRKPLRRV